MKYLSFLKTFIIVFLLQGCSVSEKLQPTQHYLTVAEDTYVTEEGGKSKLVTVSEKIIYNNKPLLFEKPGHVSVLVIPGSTTPTTKNISLKEIDSNELNQSLMRKNNQVIDDIVGKILKFQKAIATKNFNEAYEISNSLSLKYPGVSYLNYLKASCLLIQNKKQMAIEVLEETLEKFPFNREAMSLYSSIVPLDKQRKFLKMNNKENRR